MKLSDEDKQKIIESLASEIVCDQIHEDFEPVLMIDRAFRECDPEVILTSAEGFGKHTRCSEGLWDFISPCYRSDPVPVHTDICFLDSSVGKSFHVSREDDPEFIEQVKQAIQLGRL